ncbi:MAG: FAD-dependent oxidoreductase [Lachnospiraceae bacterium]|nr:FAD-dependent oxidoreductase [Lachnospiraceae bacterium]
MKKVLIIGSGIAGLSCAIECAGRGMEVTLISPFPSERSQSVLAAGGINACLDHCQEGDSKESHIEDTLKGGCNIAGKEAVSGLCRDASNIINRLEKLGTVFSTEPNGRISVRAFGGQSYKRTCYCGASTGKQIVTALVMEARRLEGLGLITRRLWMDFYSALIKDGVCYGAILYNEAHVSFEIARADYVVIATGGQNALFGKTTGSTLCDGYVTGKLFMQGVELKNLEFIQYHPTTIETAQKKMLISEAVRGEGGRLYYEESGKRVYFMEELYGERGNLMPRDVISRCMDSTGKDIFLDISFLGKEEIIKRLPEVYDLCLKYRGIDISKDSIPVSPSVHFFMGGIAVKNDHETNIANLYAIGECASIYHGANRLGGNSLLAAIYSAKVASAAIENSVLSRTDEDFTTDLNEARAVLRTLQGSKSPFPVWYIRDMLAENMREDLGIVREEGRIKKGIEDVSYYLSIADKIHYDNSVLAYFNYSLTGILTLAKATLMCALYREESRGAHFRSDYPETKEAMAAATIISYDNGNFRTYFDLEGKYER